MEQRTIRAGIYATFGLALAALVVPAAQAATPTKTVVPNKTQVLAAQKACPFKVIDKTLPDSRRVERVFTNGRHLVTGNARDQLTNPKSGASIVLNSSGAVSSLKGAAGETHYTFTGPNILYFYPGDQGPYGKVGENGALYHIVGKVTETLDKTDVVTAFAFHGRARELCHLIA